MVRETFENVAAACYEAVYVDMTHMPQQPDRVVKLVIDMQKSAQELGMDMRLIGPDSVRTMMQQFTETSTLPFFDTLDEAKAAA